jgi:methionyl-tRNA synthetase
MGCDESSPRGPSRPHGEAGRSQAPRVTPFEGDPARTNRRLAHYNPAHMAESTVYITTPIYYVNDKPHIGHAYTTTVCDVYARFMRFLGRDVFFLTGTDEHGVKVEKSAHAHNVSPQAWADQNAAEFQKVLSIFNLTNDDFIRTTQPRHVRQVQAFVKRLLESGAVYLGEFEGWYDEGQEEYYTETKAKDVGFKSPISGRALVRATEKNYFFRLSAFQHHLEELFKRQPDFVRPEARRNEVLGRLREGLQDFPISRTNFTWGIQVPGQEEHVIWVWIDALLNYITALGLGEPGSIEGNNRWKYWPATYHVVGKEILWFHAVVWPAMLMALELPLPQCIYAHSFWIADGQKMSKTLGNFVDLPTIERYLSTYGLDAWRYYMITQGPLGAQDADFSAKHFHDIYTNDLVNTVGNCASRVTAMIEKYFGGNVPSEADNGARIVVNGYDWPHHAAAMIEEAALAMERLDLGGAAAAAIALIRKLDGFINETEPFKIAKDDAQRPRLAAVLYQCAEVVRIASLPLWAVMPERMAGLWKALGQPTGPSGATLRDRAAWGTLKPGTSTQKVALFPRIQADLSAAAPA